MRNGVLLLNIEVWAVPCDFSAKAMIDPTHSEALVHLGYRVTDCRESFVRSSGHGGQNVNKVSTCVVLVHEPTGTTVKMMRFRTQAENRRAAWALLVEKLRAGREGEKRRRQAERELVRRRNRPRPRGLKLRLLEAKRRRGRTKVLRARPDDGG